MLRSALDPFPAVIMATITAPGADVLPWDRARCSHPDGVACSGPRGCVVVHEALWAWESSLGRRWRRLSQAALRRVKRQYPHAVSPLLAYVDEVQQRGAWHRHAVINGTPAGLAYARALRELGPRYGFGAVDIGKTADGTVKRRSGASAASYLIGYLMDAAGKREKGTGVLARVCQPWRGTRRVIHCAESRRAPGRADVTMRTLRAGRRVWAWAQGYADEPEAGTVFVWDFAVWAWGEDHARRKIQRPPPLAEPA